MRGSWVQVPKVHILRFEQESSEEDGSEMLMVSNA